MARPIKVGITHGDINGIGCEIIIKALGQEGMSELCTPVVFSSPKLLSFYRKQLGINDFYFRQIASAEAAVDGEINVVNITNEELRPQPGQPSAEGGAAALLSLQKGVEALLAGQIDVLVTAPIDKHTIQSKEFDFAGHTEYLQQQAGTDARSLMILFADKLRVALATTHLPLAEVPKAITRENIEQTVKIFAKSLQTDFGIERPQIAILSLNPHNGDSGLLGHEEQDVIIPAIEALGQQGLLVFGPYSADGFFAAEQYKAFDGVVAMYHDQGLAPFKALAGANGVNFTAGLPFVRTSPDHGTAYDIAGKGVADASSMRQAIYEAIDIFRRRATYESAASNPLEKHFDTRRGDKADRRVEKGKTPKKGDAEKPEPKSDADPAKEPAKEPVKESGKEAAKESGKETNNNK